MPSATRFFVLTGALFGAALVFLTPPFMVPDEFQHTFRAWQLSRGVLLPPIGDGGHVVARVPRSFADMAAPLYALPFHPEVKVSSSLLSDELHRRLDPDDEVTVIIDDMRGKSPLVHAAPAFGLALGRLLRLPPIGCLWLSRAANLCLWLFLMAIAIRVLPHGKWTLMLVALLPMSLYEAASTSADATTNAVAWLFFAAVVAVSLPGDRRSTRREIVVLGLLAAALAQCKQIYVVLVALIGLVPRARFASRKAYWTALMAPVLAAGMSLALLTCALAVRGASPTTYAWHDGDVVAQLAYVADDPGGFVHALAISLVGFDWRGVIGSLGWNDAPLPAVAGTAGLLLLVMVAFTDGGAAPAPRQRLVAAGVAGAVVVAVTAALYLTFTQVGSAWVNGIQGRYFLPALPPLLFGVQARGRPLGRAAPAALAAVGAILLDAAAVAVVMTRFYPG